MSNSQNKSHGARAAVREMWALNIRQPHAEAILRGEKTIELRSWRLPNQFRDCDVLLVASKRPYVQDLPTGQAIGIIRFAQFTDFSPSHAIAAKCAWIPNLYAWHIANAKRIPPFAVKGRLGFYKVQMPTLDSDTSSSASVAPKCLAVGCTRTTRAVSGYCWQHSDFALKP